MQAVEIAPLGEDWVYVRCKGYGSIPVWYVCSDSARCRYGFGVKPNISGMFGTDGEESLRVEWRGVERHGRFKPISIIIRMREPDDGDDSTHPTSMFYVYRLRANGTSCIVGRAKSNASARLIADKAAAKYRCENKPEIPMSYGGFIPRGGLIIPRGDSAIAA